MATSIGEGIPWPLVQTGLDPGYSWEWFYGKPGGSPWVTIGWSSATPSGCAGT